ncbi:hypothetical protein SLA2020_024790 [Shorea laevis]
MGSSEKFFSVSLFLAHLLIVSVSQENPFLSYSCSDDKGNFTTNSTYETNLNHLFSTFTANSENDYGFYNVSFGRNSNKVYSIVLCRGDLKPDVCLNCINNATAELRNLCPNQTEAVVWYEYCMLRYSNHSLWGDTHGPSFFKPAGNNIVTDVNIFNSALSSLLYSLTDRAASGNSLRKFATGSATTLPSYPIYALVQCTPDMSKQGCTSCLYGSFTQIPQYCNGKQGCRVGGTSCYFRFETFSFYNATAVGSSPPMSPPSNGKESNSFRSTIIVVVSTTGSLILIILICICIFFMVMKSKKKVETDEIQTGKALQYDFSTIRAATSNFSETNKLGEGGFGAVYKGRLANGQEIAVKRLSMDSGQGDLEFKNEVQLLAKLEHINLVRLNGFCLEGNERLLVYEFVPNLSLDNFLFDSMKCTELDWDKRYKIIEGVAQGLLYLHNLCIIHCDLKASNILLDADLTPKISDFGMARLFAMDQTHASASRIIGTYGYMAPEYAINGQVSIKTDVFSFGVLILEIVSGQKNNSFQHEENELDLISYTWKNWREGTVLNIVDPNLREGSRAEIMRCIHIALLCVQEIVAQRPTMASVVLMLSSNSMNLPAPSHLAFMDSTSQSNTSYLQSQDVNLGIITPPIQT